MSESPSRPPSLPGPRPPPGPSARGQTVEEGPADPRSSSPSSPSCSAWAPTSSTRSSVRSRSSRDHGHGSGSGQVDNEPGQHPADGDRRPNRQGATRATASIRAAPPNAATPRSCCTITPTGPTPWPSASRATLSRRRVRFRRGPVATQQRLRAGRASCTHTGPGHHRRRRTVVKDPSTWSTPSAAPKFVLFSPITMPTQPGTCRAGTTVVSGEDAPGVRPRSKTLGDGSGHRRIQRQQAFLPAAIRKATDSQLLLNPARVYSIPDTATKSLTVSLLVPDGVRTDEGAGRLGAAVKPQNITSVTLFHLPQRPQRRSRTRLPILSAIRNRHPVAAAGDSGRRRQETDRAPADHLGSGRRFSRAGGQHHQGRTRPDSRRVPDRRDRGGDEDQGNHPRDVRSGRGGVGPHVGLRHGLGQRLGQQMHWR